MLWLLLLTSGVNKWAQLSPGGSRALAGVQLAMSSGVGFLLGAAIVMSGVGIVRRWSIKRRLTRGHASDGATPGGAEEGGDGSGVGGALALDSAKLVGRASKMGSSGRGSLASDDALLAGDIAAGYCGGAAAAGSLKAGTAGQRVTSLSGAGRSPAIIRVLAGPPSVAAAAAGAAEATGASGGLGGLAPGGGTDGDGGGDLALVRWVWWVVARLEQLKARQNYTPNSCISTAACDCPASAGSTAACRRQRPLVRNSSSMSRRSAAEDLELRLPVEGVQRSDSSTFLPLVAASAAATAVASNAGEAGQGVGGGDQEAPPHRWRPASHSG